MNPWGFNSIGTRSAIHYQLIVQEQDAERPCGSHTACFEWDRGEYKNSIFGTAKLANAILEKPGRDAKHFGFRVPHF